MVDENVAHIEAMLCWNLGTYLVQTVYSRGNMHVASIGAQWAGHGFSIISFENQLFTVNLGGSNLLTPKLRKKKF